MYVCMYVYMYVYLYVCLYVCMYVCMYVCVCIYDTAHVQVYKQTCVTCRTSRNFEDNLCIGLVQHEEYTLLASDY